jgi:hypothetical protein
MKLSRFGIFTRGKVFASKTACTAGLALIARRRPVPAARRYSTKTVSASSFTRLMSCWITTIAICSLRLAHRMTIDHRGGFLRRKPGTGLVEQQQGRLGQQRHRELKDLALAMRELGRPALASGKKRVAADEFVQHRTCPAIEARPQQVEPRGAAAPGDAQILRDGGYGGVSLLQRGFQTKSPAWGSGANQNRRLEGVRGRGAPRVNAVSH